MRYVFSLCGVVGALGAAVVFAEAPIVVEGIPHVRQKPDFCGEACVEMVLRKMKSAVGPR